MEFEQAVKLAYEKKCAVRRLGWDGGVYFLYVRIDYTLKIKQSFLRWLLKEKRLDAMDVLADDWVVVST
jgi:hypothetical protein